MDAPRHPSLARRLLGGAAVVVGWYVSLLAVIVAIERLAIPDFPGQTTIFYLTPSLMCASLARWICPLRPLEAALYLAVFWTIPTFLGALFLLGISPAFYNSKDPAATATGLFLYAPIFQPPIFVGLCTAIIDRLTSRPKVDAPPAAPR